MVVIFSHKSHNEYCEIDGCVWRACLLQYLLHIIYIHIHDDGLNKMMIFRSAQQVIIYNSVSDYMLPYGQWAGRFAALVPQFEIEWAITSPRWFAYSHCAFVHTEFGIKINRLRAYIITKSTSDSCIASYVCWFSIHFSNRSLTPHDDDDFSQSNDDRS